jgi:hypothetical protein
MYTIYNYKIELEFPIDPSQRDELVSILISSKTWMNILKIIITNNKIQYRFDSFKPRLILLNKKTENNIINMIVEFDTTINYEKSLLTDLLFHLNCEYVGPQIFGDKTINYAKPFKSFKKDNVSIDISELNKIFRCNCELIHYCGEEWCEGNCGVQSCGACIDTCRCCEDNGRW